MAKRKLSDSKRKALREDIQDKLNAGVPRKALVKALSSKYGISPISMRWYLRTQPAFIADKAASRPSVDSVSLQSVPAQTPSQAALAKALMSKGTGDGADASLLDVLNGLTHHKINQLIEAKKLIPKLQVFRRHETEIRGQIRRLEKRLESEVGKARGVEAQIKRLAGL